MKNNNDTFSINLNKNSLYNPLINKILLTLGLYSIPIVAWLPFQTTLIVFRNTFSTSAIILLLLFFFINNLFKSKKNTFLFFILFLFSTVLSFINVHNNAKSSFLEFNFTKKQLAKINEDTKHIHIIHPPVGYSYLGFKSFNEEFNRPSVLTWQENSRFINSALLDISNIKNKKIVLHDCETIAKQENKLPFPFYKTAFPTNWDLKNCIKKLKKNWVLITFFHPHNYVDKSLNNHSHLNRQARYSDLVRGLNLSKFSNEDIKNTLVIDYNQIYSKKNDRKIEKKDGLIEYLRSFVQN